MARDDIDDLVRRFAAIPKEVRKAIKPAIDKGAAEIEARMKHLAPSEDGNLAASIRQEAGPVELSTTILVDDPASLYQEYGTRKMERNSFFWPAFNSLKNRVRRRIDRAAGKAIKDSFK